MELRCIKVTIRGGGEKLLININRVHLTSSSLRSVRRESGMEECGDTLGVQAPNEPLGLSAIDHSMT